MPGVDGSIPIIEHVDVRRMLMQMKAKTAAARAICYETALALDLAHAAGDEAERNANAALGALLTPVAKAFGTDVGVEVASIGVQIHGGMGFIEETGAAQHLRDARITPIYEGTNGIQALDLVTRKLPLENGETLARYLTEKSGLADRLIETGNEDLKVVAASLQNAIAALQAASDFIAGHLHTRDERATALATPYLELFGLVAGGAGLAKGALAAAQRLNNKDDMLRLQLARYFAEVHLPHTAALRDAITGGAGTLAAVTPELLNATGGH